MNNIFYMSLISLIFSHFHCYSNESSEDVYLRMISSGIQITMEEYHATDWKEVSQTASKFWTDPTPVLDQEVRKLHGKFYRYLLNVFLGDKVSTQTIMKHYFEYQLDCLVADYQKFPVSRYQFWSKIPPQYHATLAFEFLAVESGIKLDRNYHDVFSLASERARLIEEEALKIKETEKEALKITPPPPPPAPSFSTIPKAPQSPSLRLNHPTKNRPLKPTKSHNHQIDRDVIIAAQSSLKKTRTRAGESSLSEDVLFLIRKGGFKLKPASERILKDLPSDQQDTDLLAILQKRFVAIRPSIEGRN